MRMIWLLTSMTKSDPMQALLSLVPCGSRTDAGLLEVPSLLAESVLLSVAGTQTHL